MRDWSDRRVVVTGGGGFLGHHLVSRLSEAGARVTAPRSRDCDLLRPEEARELLAGSPDVVFHLAARVGGIQANRLRPADFFRDTLLMGLHVLEGARTGGAGVVVQAGTVCSYPAETSVPFREGALWDGYPERTNGPYGIAKRALIAGSDAYARQYDLRVVNLLLLNLYGEGDSFDPETSHVIPALIRKCLEAVESGATEVTVWGDGSATRGFLHVRDAVEGMLAAADAVPTPDPVNLGSPGEIRIAELARKIAKFC
ncbi:MAG: NAD-dependent epimerase/dehydratase family protein, partial [Gemmatimonadota bacterium]|nr:NAD-dependent epimerase/dehydratase family protein [Gemmatimonadota bacterium]